MKSVKRLVPSVIVLTLSLVAGSAAAQALEPEGGIVGSVKEDLRAIDDAETNELDVDELVAADEAASAGTPLNLRKGQPLALANDKPTNGWWWKLLLSVATLGGAVWLLKRRGAPSAVKKTAVLDVLTRKSVGVRSEICIVSVDGHRLLLGITPNSIQRLASLPDPDDEMTLAEVEPAPDSSSIPMEPGFGGVLKNTYERIVQIAEEQRVGRGVTMAATELEEVPPPASSQPRIVVRDSPSPSSRGMLHLGGGQAEALSSLRRKAS